MSVITSPTTINYWSPRWESGAKLRIIWIMGKFCISGFGFFGELYYLCSYKKRKKTV